MIKGFISGLGSVLDYFWAKLLLTIPVGYFVFGEKHYLIIYALFIVLVLDTILGIWVSVKYKVFASHRLGRITAKMGRYAIGLLTVWCLSCVSPDLFGWVFSFFGTFFILTEVFSNFEKLSLLGLHLPTKLLARLNKQFHDFYFGEQAKKEVAVSKILSKNSRQYEILPEDINLDKNIFCKK